MNADDIQVKIEALLRQHGPFGEAAKEIAVWVYQTFVEPTFTSTELSAVGTQMLQRSFFAKDRWDAEQKRCEGVFRELSHLLVTEEAKALWRATAVSAVNAGARPGTALEDADTVVQGYQRRTG